MSPQAQLIVFDLGGVLGSLGRPAEQMGLGISNADFWSVWLRSETVMSLETGEIDEVEFFERFPRELGLADSAREFRRRFMRWQLGLFPGVADMLRSIGESRSVALLSNTNPIHWNMVDPDGGFRQLFKHVFLSFEIGYVKPHLNIFDHVLNAVPHEPGEILFLDDTAANVEAAATLGIGSICVSGPDETRRVLEGND